MLTPREIKFCDFVAQGKSGDYAWINAGYKVKDKSVASASASRKLKEAEIKQEVKLRKDYYKQLRIDQFTDNLLTVLEKRSHLADIVRGKASDESEEFLFDMPPTHRERIAAIETDSKLAGDFEPEKRQVAMQLNLGEALNDLIGNDFGTFSAE